MAKKNSIPVEPFVTLGVGVSIHKAVVLWARSRGIKIRDASEYLLKKALQDELAKEQKEEMLIGIK